jgi:cardiolipin synthase
MTILRYAAVTLVVLIAGVLALVGVLTLTRSLPVKQVIAEGDAEGPPHVADSLFARSMELYTGTHIEGGNEVEVLLNGGGTYPVMWRDIASAQRTLTMQTYYSQPGAVADSLAKHLIERARAGVRVLLLLDAFGSGPLKGDWIDRLRRERVEVAWLRPIHWYSLDRATNRSHVRALIVDGRIGHTGGGGIADYWLGDGRHEDQWRETGVRFTGPAVAALQATFAAGWAEATGELLTGDLFFPAPAAAGSLNAGLLHTIPSPGSTPAERFLALSIAGARRTLYIANSYFVPDENFRGLLKSAVRRGVDVRILTASDKTDIKTTWYAGRAIYEELLAAGLRIYEYEPTMMHAKTFVVDGTWSTIGSLNFDNRSLAFNNESNLVVLDPAFGRRMDEIFLDDLRYSKEIRLAEFRRRPRSAKLLEWGASRLWRIL